LKLLLNEMYPPRLAEAWRAAGGTASTASEVGVAGRSDPEVFEMAVSEGWTLLTENVADYTRISADHVNAGRHHHGLLIALSSRFSRRPPGIGPLVAAIGAIADETLSDRVVYV